MKNNNKTTRRNFIKSSALITGGAMIAPYSIPSAYATGSDEIKICLVGCGGRGTGATFQALNTSQNVKLVAVADVFKDQLDDAVEKISKKHASKVDLPQEHKFVGFDAYKKAIDLADVVLLATPPGFRPMHFEYAIEKGKHVFMEKPVAVDGAGIRQVLAAAKIAKEKKLNVVVGLQRRYQKNYQETIQRLHDGLIGDIIGGQVFWNSGGVWVREREPQQTEMEYQMRNWYYFNWLCGDHITEQHVHQIDIINWVKNGYPVKAEGTGGRLVRTGKDHGEIYDHHNVRFTYEDGSIINSECRHFSGVNNRVDESFVGTKGKVYLNASHQGKIWGHKGSLLFEHNGKGDPNPYQTEHDLLFAAIANGEYTFADAERAAKSTLSSIMGRYATYSGKSISYEDALNAQIVLMPDILAWDALPKVLPNEDGYYPYAIPGKTKVI